MWLIFSSAAALTGSSIASLVRQENMDDTKPETGEQAQVNGNAEVAATPEADTAQAPTNPNFKWYILHTYSGFERKVKESLESRVQAFGLQEKIGRVVIPTETVTTIRGGKKYTSEQMFYPGYVLVEMDLDDNVWHMVKATPRVTGFLGGEIGRASCRER